MSFEEQLAQVYPDLLRLARGLAGSATDGDDLLQEALMQALAAYPRLRDRSRFRFWMLKIISNRHRSLLRKRRIRQWLTLEAIWNLPAPTSIAFEEKEALRQALGKLPREQRESLVLFEIVGLSVAEIADMLELSASAVKSRLSRGRNKLRELYFRSSEMEGYHAVKIV